LVGVERSAVDFVEQKLSGGFESVIFDTFCGPRSAVAHEM
jgi:hypothetical protein